MIDVAFTIPGWLIWIAIGFAVLYSALTLADTFLGWKLMKLERERADQYEKALTQIGAMTSRSKYDHTNVIFRMREIARNALRRYS